MEHRTGYISPIVHEDRQAVMDIFNHYILHSFAAYREEEVPVEMFDKMVETANGYPTGAIRGREETVLGFGMLRAHRPIPEFRHAAEIMYFLHPDHLGKGLGRMLLQYLEEEGRRQGITTILAHISSRNPLSLRFHLRNGFLQCGRFEGVGKKHGLSFDTVWMQKML